MARPEIEMDFEWTAEKFKILTPNGTTTKVKSYPGIYNAEVSIRKGRRRLQRATILTTGVGLTTFSLGSLMLIYGGGISRNLEDIRTAGLFLGEGVGLVFVGYNQWKKRMFADFQLKKIENFRRNENLK